MADGRRKMEEGKEGIWWRWSCRLFMERKQRAESREHRAET